MSDLKHEEKIAEMMGYYQKGFPVQTRLDENSLVLYAENLAEYTIPQLNAAMKKIIRTCKYFPSIAEICEAVESLTEYVSTDGKGIPDAGEAFREVIEQAKLHSVFTDKWKFSTPAIAKAVQRFGKNEVLYMDESEIGIARAQFRKIYEEELNKQRERKVNNEVLKDGRMANLVNKLAGKSKVLALEGRT